MSTSLFLAGWDAEGLRCPDHAVSFERSPEEVHPISLVQMPNGTGKTTTLHLLRAALSGSADRSVWTPNQVRALAKRGNESGGGSFRVKLLINGRLTTICMNFDFDQGTVHYTTTLSSGMKNGFHPPKGAEKFLVPEFVNFFVFDGELAEHLLSRQHTDAQTVIENLFQLSLFTDVAKAVGQYYDNQTLGRGATEERGLARRRNRVDLLRQRIRTMKDEKDVAVSRYDATKQSLAKHKSKFESDLEEERDHGERLRGAQKELAAAHSMVQKLSQEVLGRMRDPQALSSAFGTEMLHLKISLDRVKLPESTAREFFEELADEALCVCGRELDDNHRKAIRERAKQYLGSEDVAFLNALKGDIASLVGSDPKTHETDVDGRIARLLDAIRTEDEAATAYNALEADAVANDPALQEAKSEIERLEDDLQRLDERRRKYESQDDSASDENTYGIKVLERRLEDAERKLAEITDTINLRKKRGVLAGILEAALEMARAGISQEISTDTNTRIMDVMPHNAIRVQRVERCLVLEGQEGGSAGETLSVAYAFLATLFNRVEEHQLPFIVDSPANPIDIHIRTKVAELIPKLTRQFVAFTITTERQAFIAPLEAASSAPIQYFTLFRRGPVSLENEARKHDMVITKDGVLVRGREFFSSFQLESEENTNAIPIA